MSQACLSIYYCILEWPTLEECALHTAPFYCTTHIHWRSVPSTRPHFTALLTYTGGACPPCGPILLHYSHTLEEHALHTAPFYCTTHIHWRSVPSTRPHFTALLTHTGGACPPHGPILLHYSHILEERALHAAPFYCTTHYTGGACPPHGPILLHYSHTLEERAPFHCTNHIHWRSVPSTRPHFTALLTVSTGEAHTGGIQCE